MKRILGCAILLFSATLAVAQTTTGTWTLYPPQSTSYQVSVQQPINPEGNSVWSANKGVVPVQFKLAVGYGPVVFQSIWSDGTFTANDYSYLSFTPGPPLSFSQITSLSAVYSFTQGNCQGGSLRWEVGVGPNQAIFIYYGATPNFTDCTSDGPTVNQSGINMVSSTDARYDTSQLFGGTFYDTYAHALTLAGTATVTYAALVLDSGWFNMPNGDQKATLGNVTVNDNTFVPQSGSSATCSLPQANIQLTRTAGGVIGAVDEQAIQQNADYGSSYRIVDCKYMYNLAAKSLGTGTYKVEVLINNAPATGFGTFALK